MTIISRADIVDLAARGSTAGVRSVPARLVKKLKRTMFAAIRVQLSLLILHSIAGSVLDLDPMALDRQSEFLSVDKQSNDDVMHLNRFGKADRLACQALDART
jgi:hypothetical protein